MPDQLLPVANNISKLMKDMGDGTHAEVVVVGASAAGQSRLPVNTLGQPATARSLAVSATSAGVQLTAGVTQISIKARETDIRYRLGPASSIALVTDHFIESGERLDIKVPSGWWINAIGTGSGSLEITELT